MISWSFLKSVFLTYNSVTTCIFSPLVQVFLAVSGMISYYLVNRNSPMYLIGIMKYTVTEIYFYLLVKVDNKHFQVLKTLVYIECLEYWYRLYVTGLDTYTLWTVFLLSSKQNIRWGTLQCRKLLPLFWLMVKVGDRQN